MKQKQKPQAFSVLALMQDQVILHRLPACLWEFPPFLHELQASPLWGWQTTGTRILAPSWHYLLETWVSNLPLKSGFHLVQVFLFIRTEGSKRPQPKAAII